MMGNGTNTRDKDAFDERIDFLGANLYYGSQSASLSSLSRFFPEVFELMADGLLNPVFSEEEFNSQKSRLIEGIRSQQKSAQAVSGEVRRALAYGKNHPYGEFTTEEIVEKLQVSDVKNYYNNFINIG